MVLARGIRFFIYFLFRFPFVPPSLFGRGVGGLNALLQRRVRTVMFQTLTKEIKDREKSKSKTSQYEAKQVNKAKQVNTKQNKSTRNKTKPK
jgi:hypothetical protein